MKERVERVKEQIRFDAYDCPNLVQLVKDLWNERIHRNKAINMQAMIVQSLQKTVDKSRARERKLEEALEAVHELWGGDRGFEDEADACKSLEWRSPLYKVWINIRQALSGESNADSS